MVLHMPFDEPGTLRLDRGDAEERFAVMSAVMRLDEADDSDEIFFCLEVRCGERTASAVANDISDANAQPNAEVFALLPSHIDLDDMPNLVGSEIAVTRWRTNTRRDLWNRFYYCEHEDLWDVTVDVLAHRDDRLNIRWVASSRDVDHRDRTMRVEVDAWFRFEG